VFRRPQVEVERYIRFAETEREPDGPLPMGAHSVSSAVSLLRAGWPHDNVGVALKAAEAAAAEETDPSRGTYILARCSLGQALFLSGRAEEAIAQLTAVLNAPLAPLQPLVRIVARAILAAVWVDRGDPARAMELARRAVEEATEARLPLVPLLWWVPVALSRVLVQVGQLDEAERLLSAELEQRLPEFRPLARAVVLLAMARVRFGLGHPQAGWSLLEQARVLLAGFADPGILPTWLSETERSEARQPRHGQLRPELSEGELRVMHLLATDLTRREIGQELYLSINTVRTHMRSIYTKLDVASREEAVARARALALII
jgi:LuxR family maltose regulon positive regulatory protein